MGKIGKIILCVFVCLLVGLLGSLSTSPAIPTWYATLIKPSFNPPNWLFGPAWTLLYILMGVAVALVWDKIGEKKEVPMGILIFGVQLLLNCLWSIIFFGYHSPFYAFIEIIFMWLAILATILYFSKISKTAAWLLVPYICWVSFAMLLNFSIYRLNP